MEFLAGKLNIPKEQAIAQIAQSNSLKLTATIRDTANLAVLIASDRRAHADRNGTQCNRRSCSGLILNRAASSLHGADTRDPGIRSHSLSFPCCPTNCAS